MFKLVGAETVYVGKSKTMCTIKIEPVGGFTYQYSLEVSWGWVRQDHRSFPLKVAGKSFKKFIESQNKG